MHGSQAGLDYAQPLQTFVPLLCENLPQDNCAPFASLKGQESAKEASSNLTVASLAALQEYIPFRCIWTSLATIRCDRPRSGLCLTGLASRGLAFCEELRLTSSQKLRFSLCCAVLARPHQLLL